MSRRSTPQSKIDDRSFPVRLLIYVPEDGFGNQINQIHDWLRDMIGNEDHALHSGGRGRGIRDIISIYFRNPHDAVSLLYAFPDLELADGTILPGYTSPYVSSGRRKRSDA